MKQKLTILFLLVQAFYMLNAQTMTLLPQSGGAVDYDVSTIKKLTFDSGNMILSSTIAADVMFALSDNRKISFSFPSLKTISNPIEKTNFYAYLNPITAILTISNPAATTAIINLDIISLDGRVVKTQRNINNHETQLSIADLKRGVYLARINTETKTQTIKFLNL